MNKEFIPYEQALALKEIGFNEKCIAYYSADKKTLSLVNGYGELMFADYVHLSNTIKCIPTPLYQQAFRWFRERHSWEYSINPTSDQHNFKLGYNYWIWNPKTGEEFHTMDFDRPIGDWKFEKYEEAELACLEKMIEFVKKSKL